MRQPHLETTSLRIALAIAALLTPAAALPAQELSVLAGKMWDVARPQSSYSWRIDYQEGLGEHAMATVGWLNEGHVEGHHRDGYTLQLWARAPLLSRRLTLALGAGPYRYFDTANNPAGGFFNDHGWGAIVSVSASYYLGSRIVLRADANRIWARPNTIDTRALLFGLGYQLQMPTRPGPRRRQRPQPRQTTRNELTLFIGRTVVNSFHTARSVAVALEYRRGIAKHIDLTLTALDEGDPELIRRYGVAAQLWAVRAFLRDRLTLGIGGGAYVAVDQRFSPGPLDEGAGTVAGLVTPTISWRFSRHFALRFNWERTVSSYHRDTDIFLLGPAYRF
jgi:hypothetical protein